MFRRFMIWLGVLPVTGEILVWNLPNGDIGIRLDMDKWWWATEGDVMVFRVRTLIHIQNLLGGREKIRFTRPGKSRES